MRLIITEEERRSIKKLYGLITEQETTSSSGTSIDRKITFPAGYYNESYVSEALTEVTQQISNFLTQNPTNRYIVSITLEAGESQIPNTDREQGNIPVGPGVLARARQTTINNFLTRSIGELVTSGVLPQMPTFNFTEPVIGATPWVGTPFCPTNSTDEQQRGECKQRYSSGAATTYSDYKEKYDAEQYVRVIVVVSQNITPTTGTTALDCSTNMIIELNYESGNHICDSSVYQLYANGVLLLRDDGKDYASLNNYTPKEQVGKRTHGLSLDKSVELQKYDNNLGDAGGRRYNKFIVTSEMAKEFLSGDKKTITVSAKCYNPANYYEDGKDNMLGIGKAETKAWGYDCHTDVGKIKVTNAAGQVKKFTPRKTPNKRDEVVTMFTFDPCTLERVTSVTAKTEAPAQTK
jgi:hypothetical protein